MFCVKCGHPVKEEHLFCVKCGAELTFLRNSQTSMGYGSEHIGRPDLSSYYPMNWHKFVIYVQLFLSMVVYLSNGVGLLSGLVYESTGVSSALVYAFYGVGLRTVDIAFGLIFIAYVPFALFVQYKMRTLRRKAPNILYAYYCSGPLLSLLYVFSAFLVTGEAAMVTESFASIVGSCIGTALLVLLSYKYYSKREFLFVN